MALPRLGTLVLDSLPAAVDFVLSVEVAALPHLPGLAAPQVPVRSGFRPQVTPG